jgi:DNA-binding transcriptional LysR family regulator
VQQLKRWPGIELRHLEALAVVVDEGSFRRAARKLGYTQSAISQQIAALERAVGHAVLERPSRGRPLALTEVGARLRRLHDTVEHAISAARADVAAAAAGVGHVVRVGTPFSFSHLSEAVVAMRVRHPRVVVEVVSAADDDRLLRLLETGAVDLAVVRTTGAGAPIEERPAAMCSYTAAIPSVSQLARAKKRVALEDLGCFARIATADGTAYADDVAAPVVASDAEMALGLVGAGAGAAVLPSLFAGAPPATVAIRPLRDILPPFSLSIATAGQLVPQAADLCDLLVAAIGGWPNAGSAGSETQAEQPVA